MGIDRAVINTRAVFIAPFYMIPPAIATRKVPRAGQMLDFPRDNLWHRACAGRGILPDKEPQ
jgi:hypothetical protein